MTYKKLACRRCGHVWKWSLDKKDAPYCPKGHGCAKEGQSKRGNTMKFSRNVNNIKTEVEMHDDSTLDEVLEEFQLFLRACGYVIEYNKVLDLVDMDE